jgi:anti-sigma B factor antagonist
LKWKEAPARARGRFRLGAGSVLPRGAWAGQPASASGSRRQLAAQCGERTHRGGSPTQADLFSKSPRTPGRGVASRGRTLECFPHGPTGFGRRARGGRRRPASPRRSIAHRGLAGRAGGFHGQRSFPQREGRRPAAPPRSQRAPDDRARKPGSELDGACREQADLILLTLVGALDTYTTPGFQEYARRYDPGKVQLVIDLVGVSFLDSAGLSALLSLRTQADRAGAQLGLVCPDPSVVRLFRYTGLHPLFVFGGDLTAVRAALRQERRGANPLSTGPS